MAGKTNTSPRKIRTLKLIVLLAMTLTGILFTNFTKISQRLPGGASFADKQFLTKKDFKRPY